MKTKSILSTCLALLLTTAAYSQENGTKDYLWSSHGKKGTRTFGLYGGLYGTYSTVAKKSAHWFSARLGVAINHRWGIGLSGSVLNYDYELNDIVVDGTYRLQAGSSGLFIERMFNITDWSKLNLSWTTGAGVVFYEYNKEYREERPWYEETIDTENFASNELGLELQFKTFGKWWVGFYGSYRFTSPIMLMGTEEHFLNNYSAGISLKYGLF